MASPDPEASTQAPLLSNSDAAYGTTDTPSHSSPQTSHKTFTPTLTTLTAFSLVISIVIGSGVFTSPGAIDTNSPSPFLALATWLIGGLLAWTGAATLAELGTAIPGEGGVQPFLAYVFGDVWGFLAAWTWTVAVMPATLGILGIAFAETILLALENDAGKAQLDDGTKGWWIKKGIAIAALLVVTAANCISTKVSTRLNSFFVVTKFVSIAGVVVAALAVVGMELNSNVGENVGGHDWFERSWFRFRDTLNPDGSDTHWKALSTWEILGHMCAALYGALWAYSGWDKAVYISAELSNPAKQLPLAIHTALPTIIASFIAANTAYYILLPWSVVSTTDSVALTATTRLLGHGFGILAAILICLVIAGSLLGNLFVASRMAVAAANRGWFPSFLAITGGFRPAKSHQHLRQGEDDAINDATSNSKVSLRSDAPIPALLLSSTLAIAYILLGNFRSLLTFNGLAEYTFFFLTVISAIVLRFREPKLARPYKPLLVVPITFAVVSGFVVIRGAVFAPILAAVLIGLWAGGLACYIVRRRWFGAARHAN